MKSTFTFIIILFSLFQSQAQTKVYKGNSTSYSDCIFTINDDKIYTGNSTSYSDCLLTFNDGKIYKGNSTSYSDCIMTTNGIMADAVMAILAGPY